MSYKSNKKWRLTHPEKWSQQRDRDNARYYARGEQHKLHHNRQAWTTEEFARITSPDRPADMILAQQLGRTVRAIQIQRCKLKK